MTNDTREDFGVRLGKLLKMKKMTQKELAKIIGVSSVSVSLYVSGKNLPHYETLIKIIKVTGANTSWLLGMKE